MLELKNEERLTAIPESRARLNIKDGWLIVLRKGATKLSYAHFSEQDGRHAFHDPNGLILVGEQSRGYARAGAELTPGPEAHAEIGDSNGVLGFYLGSEGDVGDGFVDKIEIVRRRPAGDFVQSICILAQNVPIPARTTAHTLTLRPEDRRSLQDAVAELLRDNAQSDRKDRLLIEFEVRSAQIALRVGRPTLISVDAANAQDAGIIRVDQAAPAAPEPPAPKSVAPAAPKPVASPAPEPAASPAPEAAPAVAQAAEAPPAPSAQPPAPPPRPAAAPTANAKEVRAIENEINHLERALWGGYSQVAADTLNSVARSRLSHPEARIRAAWELARWYSVKGEFQLVADLLAEIRTHSKPFTRRKTYRLVEINALLQIGDLEVAERRVQDALRTAPQDSDYLLAGANLAYRQAELGVKGRVEAQRERLEAFNTIFRRDGLAPLVDVVETSGLTIAHLRCDTAGREVREGPKVSVLMAAYEAEKHLHIAVDSILGQTWRNLELIIVDDCSPDATWEKIQAYAAQDTRVRAFRNAENLGAYATRNFALAQVTGDFVTVHDSDDWSHPEMLAIQIAPLLEREEVHATFSMMCRVTEDLRFGIRPSRRNLEIVHRSYPSLLLRRRDLEQVGIWDGVRANADAEMVARLRVRFGPESLVEVLRNTPLSFFLVRPESLTEQGETSLLSLTFGVRHEYDRQALHMGKKWEAEGVLPGKRTSKKEPFASPQLLLPHAMRPEPDYDVILVSDLSLLGGTRSCNLAYIDAAVAAGRRVGLFHWPRGDLRLLPDIDPTYRDRNQNPLVDVITCEEEARCKLLILHHPPVMKHMLDRLPRIAAEHGVILVNQLPYQVTGGRNIFYEPLAVERDFKRLFGIRPRWAPISALVRRHLTEQDSNLEMIPDDWLPPINMPLREAAGRQTEDRPPVVGRHSRDHWTKWPETAAAIRAAYVADTDIAVRILGGAHTPRRLLNDLPPNWEVLEFDEVAVVDFIDSLDFLIHFPHTKYIEEFGRTVAEAMARGVPVILPPVFRETFLDAAAYCEIDAVEQTIRAIWSDPERYAALVQAGRDFVLQRCHAACVQGRLSSVLGGLH